MRPTVVLLVEDDPVIACAMQVILHQAGLQVLLASCAQEAMAHCAQIKPDIALLNVRQTPETDGITLAGMLCRQFGIPVKFVTGARTQDVPASDCGDALWPVLNKPFTNSQLMHFVADTCTQPVGNRPVP
ncbi:MAG: response regulator [Lewinellaceae bacterium]|nr:response regulator [Lewinellaceae bacterium]